ncbi:hypothetical protein RIF29_28189 [Crotalaria pallida]|uniref:BRCT domain-containing protein n=1 Tax=Crotalaria pallida TaxID=3830 RepID=A0AAN9I6C5_CROPI
MQDYVIKLGCCSKLELCLNVVVVAAMSNNNNNNNKGSKRNLPSWMSARDNDHDDGNSGKKPALDCEDEKRSGSESSKKKAKVHNENAGKCSVSGSVQSKSFDKLLEGVVFVLSGFVNPERGMLRSQALEMGAEYKPDWNSDCTLLVCAFANTPKFRQVEAECGTIVSKDWIVECHTQRKLVEIDSYLMHAGKPWRKGNTAHEANEEKKSSVPKKSPMRVERDLPSKSSASVKIKGKDSDVARKHLSPSEVKKWAIDDLNKTIQWLECQEEKPDPSEITKIAAEGILTCVQDAISSLKEKQDIRKGTEDWSILPRVVDELAKLDGEGNNTVSISKEDLYREALDCKRIYEEELNNLDDEGKKNSKISEEHRSRSGITKGKSSSAVEYDSDETIEMTEEEIDQAYKTLSSI